MPGGRGKARRSCKLCKPYKFAGNSKDRRTPKETARTLAAKDEIKDLRGS